jgi:hypothetical protein
MTMERNMAGEITVVVNMRPPSFLTAAGKHPGSDRLQEYSIASGRPNRHSIRLTARDMPENQQCCTAAQITVY